MAIRLSIIVPVYNIKKYLKGCLNSICEQVRKNVEVIIVNERSTDGSIKICKNFAKKYNFIRLINLKKNKRVAYCRNIAVPLTVLHALSNKKADRSKLINFFRITFSNLSRSQNDRTHRDNICLANL